MHTYLTVILAGEAGLADCTLTLHLHLFWTCASFRTDQQGRKRDFEARDETDTSSFQYKIILRPFSQCSQPGDERSGRANWCRVFVAGCFSSCQPMLKHSLITVVSNTTHIRLQIIDFLRARHLTFFCLCLEIQN